LSGFEALFKLFEALDLGFVERVLSQAYRPVGSVGRPHRDLLSMFKAELVKRLKAVESYREFHRLLEVDEVLRSLCGIKRDVKPFDRSTLTRFRQRVGPERFQRIMSHVVKQLDSVAVLDAGVLALDATFIKAHSRRNMDNRTGYSDPESRVGRAYRTYGLGYKLHMAVDTASGAPLTFLVAPANTNEKRVSIPLLKATIKITDTSIRQLAADSQYSSNSLRETAERYRIETAIPYPANQKTGKHNVLRVTKDFKTHGPQRLKRIYRKRSIIELVFAWLKEHLNLNNHKVRGLERVTIHISYCLLCLLYTIEASHNTNQPLKSRSITYWAN